MSVPEHNPVGTFLRARRIGTRPESLGISSGTGRRRTPGIRREELAAAADVSLDYYVRIEQGRERPSPAVITALANALRLTDDERRHLLALGTGQVRRQPSATPAEPVSPGILTLLETVRPSPAYVLTRASQVLAANPEGAALLPGLADRPPAEQNTIRYLFTHPAAERLFGDRDQAEADNVAHLRSVLIPVPGEPPDAEVAALVEEMIGTSARFAARWNDHRVAHWTSRDKIFHHPTAGDLVLHSETMTLADHGRRLVLYQAADSETAERLHRLASAASAT